MRAASAPTRSYVAVILGQNVLSVARLEKPITGDRTFLPVIMADDDADAETVGITMDSPDSASGSNNWVIGRTRTASGLPLLASDPHIAFETGHA